MRMTTAKDLPKACFLCGRNGTADPLDAHHIFGGANRKLSEKYALVIPLCHNRCHENGKDAVHQNAATAQAVHEFGQRLYMERMGWSIEEFRAVFGRNYIPDPSESEDLFEDLFEDPSGGRSPRGVTFPTRGKSPKARQRGPIPRRSPLETLPDGQGRNLRVSPIGSSFLEAGDEGREAVGSSFRGTGDEGSAPFDPLAGDEGRETMDGGFCILDEEVMPAWV